MPEGVLGGALDVGIDGQLQAPALGRLVLPEDVDLAPTAVDDLIRRCQFSGPSVLSVLLDLELAGRIETLPGNRVALLGC